MKVIPKKWLSTKKIKLKITLLGKNNTTKLQDGNFVRNKKYYIHIRKRDMPSNRALCLRAFLRTKPKATPEGEGLYLSCVLVRTVYNL